MTFSFISSCFRKPAIISTHEKQDPLEDKRNHFFKNEGLKVAACAGSIPFLAKIVLTRTFGNRILDLTGICPSSLFPNGIRELFFKFVLYGQTALSENVMRKILPPKYIGRLFSPIFEELVDRVLLQEVILKTVPKKILKKYFPQYSQLSDHFLAKIARIATSSLFFALEHVLFHTCTDGDIYPFLIAGVFFGSFQEWTGHPIYNLIAHIAINTINR